MLCQLTSRFFSWKLYEVINEIINEFNVLLDEHIKNHVFIRKHNTNTINTYNDLVNYWVSHIWFLLYGQSYVYVFFMFVVKYI